MWSTGSVDTQECLDCGGEFLGARTPLRSGSSIGSLLSSYGGRSLRYNPRRDGPRPWPTASGRHALPQRPVYRYELSLPLSHETPDHARGDASGVATAARHSGSGYLTFLSAVTPSLTYRQARSKVYRHDLRIAAMLIRRAAAAVS